MTTGDQLVARTSLKLNERYQSIKDVAIELKELRRELQGAGIDTTLPPPGHEARGTSGSQTTLGATFFSPIATYSSPPICGGAFD